MPSSFATLAIGRDVSITIFTASSLNSGEKLFFGRGKTSPFPIVHLIGWTVRKARGTSVVHRGIQCDLHYGVLVLLGTGKGGRCRCLRPLCAAAVLHIRGGGAEVSSGDGEALDSGDAGVLVLDVDRHVGVDLGEGPEELRPVRDVVADADCDKPPGRVGRPGVAPVPVAGGDLIGIICRHSLE